MPQERARQRVMGLAGWSGSGKTTLMVQLLPELIGCGFSVSTIKHAHHAFDVDRPGKDSYRHREAGAREVLIGSHKRWALMHELRDEPEPELDDLLGRLSPVDLVLVEGFKKTHHPKIEIHRTALGKPLICRDDASVVAVASDGDAGGLGVSLPVLDLNDIAGIAGFILDYTGLAVQADREVS